MTLEEQRRTWDGKIEWKVYVETVTRTEIVKRRIPSPDPSLSYKRKVAVKQSPDGPEILIIEEAKNVENDEKRHDRNLEMGLVDGILDRHKLSEETILRLAIATLEVGSSVRKMEDLR